MYETLEEEDTHNVFLINTKYKTTEFKEQHKQALFLVLAEYYKKFVEHERSLTIPEEVIRRNMQYLASSDELLSWFEDKYEKTDSNKDIIKIKDIHDEFVVSDYFHNLNKNQKRACNKKYFVEKLQSNMFLKKYIKENKDRVLIITNYRRIKDIDEYGNIDKKLD